MQNLLKKLDELAAINCENRLARWLERFAFVFMILMFAAAPHSIAATQIAWLTGMFLWVVRLFIKKRPLLVRTSLDVPLWAFFCWSTISSIFSYDPPTSFDRLRNVALFLIFYYVINLVRTKRAAVFLAVVMIMSSMVSAAWTPIERLIGRGVEISGLSADSPLAKASMRNGDTLLKVNGKKINAPEDLAVEVEANELSKVTFYRPDYYLTVDVWRMNSLGGATAFEQLGFTDWKRSRNWRSAGFYGHYTTFAEVLQLVASLALGLFIASLGKKFLEPSKSSEIKSRTPLILAFCVAAMAFALLLTVTRASQLAFLISAASMIFIVGSRKMLLVSAAIILPVALGGLVFLQQSREVGFFDSNDDSTKYRQTIYREGINLWTENPRHFFLGVGMDSIKKYATEWRLFDEGRLPMGHFHSTPIQLLVERGLPAFLLWTWVLWAYARVLWRYLKNQIPTSEYQPPDSDGWLEKGIVLGCLGGAIGFLTAGLVHYNLGDAEVAMVFFMLMGLSAAIANFKLQISDSERSKAKQKSQAAFSIL